MDKKKIFVVVINWNKKDFTLECLGSLENAIRSKKNISVVLVDNNSSDGSQEVFKRIKYKFKFFFIQNKKNLGWTGGNNVGIKFALKNNADCILLLANDSVIKKGSIELLANKLFSSKSLGIVGPKIYEYDSKPLVIANAGNFYNSNFNLISLGSGKRDNGQYDLIEETDMVGGTAITIKKEVFKSIGFFDDRLFIYYEDADFCMRAKKAGFSFAFVQKAHVYHRGSATTIVGSPLHTYYNTRNRLIFLERYGSTRPRIAEFFSLCRILLRYFKNRKKSDKSVLYAIRDYLLRHFGERKYW